MSRSARTRFQVLFRLTLALAIVFNGLWTSWSMASMAMQQRPSSGVVVAESHAGCHSMSHHGHSTEAATKATKHGDCGRDCCKGTVCDCGCTAPVAVTPLVLSVLAQVRPLGPPGSVDDVVVTLTPHPILRPPIV